MYAEADKLLAKLNFRFTSQKLVGDLIDWRSANGGDRQSAGASNRKSSLWMNRPDALTDTETESLIPRHPRTEVAGARYRLYLPPCMKEIFEICDNVMVFRDAAVYRRARGLVAG
ncbi:hypothetical protein LNP74_12975 [Klebsiella pneumoniae subsp. pneumoniae]|nr:hypothetical protein [Klebsiella pneumoniae subsp. pneumoniae]